MKAYSRKENGGPEKSPTKKKKKRAHPIVLEYKWKSEEEYKRLCNGTLTSLFGYKFKSDWQRHHYFTFVDIHHGLQQLAKELRGHYIHGKLFDGKDWRMRNIDTEEIYYLKRGENKFEIIDERK